MRRAVSVAAAVLTFGPALAQAPVALVEEVRGKPAGIEFMDYVPAGKVIRLRPRDAIVLGYLASCWRETITGGTVTVGSEKSDVQGGRIARARVACDGGRIALTAGQAKQSAGTSFRAPDDALPTLYGLSPVIEANGGDALLIVRTDRPGEHHVATLPVRRGKRRSFFDFAAAGKTLAAGGTYRASIGTRQVFFRIDPRARKRGVPIISRLLRFPPAT